MEENRELISLQLNKEEKDAVSKVSDLLYDIVNAMDESKVDTVRIGTMLFHKKEIEVGVTLMNEVVSGSRE